MDNIKFAMVRKALPSLLSKHIVDVQPLTSEHISGFLSNGSHVCTDICGTDRDIVVLHDCLYGKIVDYNCTRQSIGSSEGRFLLECLREYYDMERTMRV